MLSLITLDLTLFQNFVENDCRNLFEKSGCMGNAEQRSYAFGYFNELQGPLICSSDLPFLDTLLRSSKNVDRSFYIINAQYSRAASSNIEKHTVSWLTFLLNCNYVAFFMHCVRGDIVHYQRMQDINITK